MRTVISILPLLLIAFLFFGCNAGRIPVPFQNPNDIPDAATFTGGGHPMEGVNYRRNNRSHYTLPVTLAAEDSIGVPYEEPAVLSELLIDGDENIYLGRYYSRGWIGTEITDYDENYTMWVFSFGGDYGPGQEGGLETVLTTDGIFTASRRVGIFWDNSGGQNRGQNKSSSSLYIYDMP